MTAQKTVFINQATKDGAYLPRHASIRVGIPIPVPALAVNRMCGSGFQSVVSGTQVRAKFFFSTFKCCSLSVIICELDIKWIIS
jgi:Thiolase, N-terminal domain